MYNGFLYWAELLSIIDYTNVITGAAQPKLSREKLGGVRVIIPSKDEIKTIEQAVARINSEFRITIKGLKTSISQLKEYKSVLIESAVTGKIKVI